MHNRHRWAFSLVPILLATLFAPLAVLAAGFTLQPEQPSAAPGQAIIFVGSGFVDGERVSSWATSPDGAVIGGEFAGASGGNLRIPFFVPGNALTGRWAFTAYGETSKTPVITTFEVIGGRTPDPQETLAAVEPASGPAGTTFAFAATGYDDKEKVSYWVTAPNGTVAAAYPSGASANEDGRVDLTWRAPEGSLSGTWVMTIQGLKSNVARAIRFEVR